MYLAGYNNSCEGWLAKTTAWACHYCGAGVWRASRPTRGATMLHIHAFRPTSGIGVERLTFMLTGHVRFEERLVALNAKRSVHAGSRGLYMASIRSEKRTLQ